MRNESRILYNAYIDRIAKLNNINTGDVSKQFAVVPSVQQTLENKIQASSKFLSMINIVGRRDIEGQKIGLGISGPGTSNTDTSNGTTKRKTTSLLALSANDYKCRKNNFDTHITYDQIDTWSEFSDFQTRLAMQSIRRQALDRIMIGWNGKSYAPNSDRIANSLLQDVNIGWLEHMRTVSPEQVKDSGNNVKLDGTGDYKNLDALVRDTYKTNIKPEYRDGTQLVAIMNEGMLEDKYFPLINEHNEPTEKIAADLIMSQKRIGGLQAVIVPYFPENAIFITPLDNLSIYYQRGARRRNIIEVPEEDCIKDFSSSRDDYVIEVYERATLIENITVA